MANFLSDTQKYETQGYRTQTNNRQSIDLGFDLINHSANDTKYIQTFIEDVEKYFDLVLISEYFDQSLVLLKRLLNWETKDILHFRKLKSNAPTAPLTPEQREVHKTFSAADRALYEHFLPIFMDKLYAQGPGLAEEVKEFQAILVQVQEFCEERRKSTERLVIPPGKWTSAVNIDFSMCTWLLFREVQWTGLHREKRGKYS